MNPTRRKIVLDTNCLVQIISTHSKYRPIWDAFLMHRFILCVSNEILEEYHEILESQTNATIAENVISLLLNSRNVL
jgi:predicted nucleic acid-binding protein